ncbi:cytochrome c oxidase assembly protein COX16 domain-containing protein [Ditylenchus destructor]|nr:cytochrome c oxidase assembly protein COX16 domain-containing protein [Ditylenchus destructor]
MSAPSNTQQPGTSHAQEKPKKPQIQYGTLKELQRGRPRFKILKGALPLFAFMIGSAYALSHFQSVRFAVSEENNETNLLEDMKERLADKGKEVKNRSIDDIYTEMSKIDTDNWENVRAPRPFEKTDPKYEELINKLQSKTASK